MKFKFITPSPWRFSAVFLLAFLFSGMLMSQDLDIEMLVPDVSSICGPVNSVAITITNNSDEDAEDVIAEFEEVIGATFLSASSPATLSGRELSIGDLDEGESVTFTVDYQTGCDFTGDDLELILNIINGGNGSFEGEAIQILTADLSIPSSTPAILGVYLGLERTVTPRLVNNGFGELSEVTYCVSNNLGYLEIQTIVVGGVDITVGGPVFTTATQNCYTIGPDAIMGAGLGETYSRGESIFPEETWLTVDCTLDPTDITRRVQFGCLGDNDCQDKPQGDFIDTGVSFALLAPRIEAEVATTSLPGCYVDEPTEVTMRLTNEGTAPALNLDFRIFTDGNGGRGMVLDLGSLMVIRESDNSPVSTSTRFQTAATDCRAPGVRDAGITIDNADLLPGESILVTYQLTASCDCNSCDIRNKYWHRFRVEQVFDRCLSTLSNRRDIDPNGRFDAFITGFPEGPTSLFSGEEGCVTYYVTNMQLDWLTGAYPDAELEAIFNLPCGVDYVPGTFVWSDRDGMTFTVESEEYIDNGTGADDELRVTFAPTGRPGGFNYAGGGQFDFCVTVDCTEKPEPACGNAYFDVVIDAQFDFTVDPTCAASCSTQKIWDPSDLPLRLVCPPTDPNCECDGITFSNLSIERINFGIADDNNDQIPSGTVDPMTIESDRFLPGDTIKATLEGFVRDADDDQDFTHGFVTYPFIHQNFTPLSARVAIYDASDGNTLYECTAVPVTPDYPNMRIIVDYSRDALNNFGCGLPTNFLFEEGDSVAVCLVYTEKDAIDDQFRLINYEPRFYVSDDEFGVGGVFQCNPLLGQMTQIGFTTVFSNSENDFGSCDLPSWTIRYDRNIGGAGIDEFPYEIRPLGLPDRLVFTKPSEFAFRFDEWDILMQQIIAPSNNIVDTRGLASPSIPAQYFVVNGDEVTFLIGDYIRSLGLAEVPPDEGYRIYMYPRIQGNCESIEAEYDYSYQFFEAVEENIFCTEEIANELQEYDFEYLGAALLTVISDQDVIRLCSGNDMAAIRVRNLEVPSAQNAFLYPQPTGSVIITRIEDANTGLEILPNQFGIYELGNIGATSERPLNVFFTKNSCDDETIDFVAGWDCGGYPETINDATCTDPSSILLTSAKSNIALVVIEPAPAVNRVIDLCDPVPYEIQILSSDLGYARDMKLNIDLPPGQSYEEGSMMFSNPSPSNGGAFVSVGDPTIVTPQRLVFKLGVYDDILRTEGLVGSKDPDNSAISFKFNALTECGAVSGSRALFTLRSRNSCGDPIRPRRRRSGRVRFRPSEPSLGIEVGPATISLNACNEETERSNVSIDITSGEITNLDSIRMILPEGLNYVAGSYLAGQNAIAGVDPEIIRDNSGGTILLWSFISGLSMGDKVEFSVGLMASDAGQICGETEVLVQAFASFETECDGMLCTVGELSGEDAQSVVIEKADFDFNLIDGSITLNPDDGTATSDFTVKLTNFGFELAGGNSVTVDIYEDVNSNGVFDDDIDTYLFSVDSTIVDPIGPGEMITISDMATFPAANVCTVIGVLNPETTCTCNELESNTFRPEIIFDYETEFDVCSGEQVTIGPMPITGYDSEWLSVNGSDLGNLSDTENTPTVFTAPANNSGAPITLQYTLRTSNAPCFDDQIVSVTVAPAVMDVINVQACMDAPYELPTVNDPNASNFVWSPSAGLTVSADGKFATVNNVTTSQVYTLSYDIGGGGCPATYMVNLTAINCGGANTALGDTVWFDFNEDGLQDPTEPGIGMVTVNLLDANTGAIISTTMTGSDGMYLFDMLPAGNYAVEFILPDGFVFTMNDQAGDDVNDSDADPVTGITPATFLPLDEQDFTIDAGFIPDCSLELELLVSECVPDGTGGLARQVQVVATWDGNPYTYDQFGDGNDILEIDFNGTITMVTISELAGTQTVIDEFLDASTPISYNVSAAFQEATACTATVMSGPFDPCLVDLALTKTASTVMPTPGPYEYGDLICMDITVFNQGDQTVDNIQVQDSLPAGFAFDETNSVDWFDISPYQLFIFPDPLAPGESVVATICVTLEMVSGDIGSYTNVAEITSFTDTMGIDLSDFDEDSTPDTEFSNDAGGEPNTDSDDSIVGDGSGEPGDGIAATDEDDNDPFFVGVFDLALVKMIDTDPFYAIGDIIEYNFMVVNQGNIPAENIEVIDYVPDGLTWVVANESATPPWSAPGAPIGMFTPSTLTIPGTLAPGDTFEFTIQLQLAPQGMTETFLRTNIAEISSATGPGGAAVVDIDSTPNSDPTDDAGGVPLSDSDNTFEGDGTGDPGDTEADTDEDDADPELVATDSVSLGSTVFIDPNNNGMQEMGEDGIPGVLLELFLDANGNMMIDAGEMTPFATTVTDANGDYYFGMLVPGNYQVQIASSNFGATNALFDYGTSSGPTSVTDDDVDGNDDGSQPGGSFTTVNSPIVRLIPTMEPTVADMEETAQGSTQDVDVGQDDENGNMTVDFGFTPNVSIGSTVFADYNNNAMQDPGEPGVPLVTLVLYYDADGDGLINGTETTPVGMTQADGLGDYFFGGLAPGTYQVGILATEFAGGNSLEFLPMSSTDISTTDDDNMVEGDDNGEQDGGDGTIVLSPLIDLQPGEELTDAMGEDGQGTEKDDDADASGDMTIDFGFVCNLEITTEGGPFPICSNKLLEISSLATITPTNVNGTWSTDGDGTFLDDSGMPVDPARYDDVLSYMPGPNDIVSGTVMLTLTSDMAGVCPPVSATIEVQVLNVDCGDVPWDGDK